MFYVNSFCTPNMKNIKGNIQSKQVSAASKYRVEPESIKSNDNDFLN